MSDTSCSIRSCHGTDEAQDPPTAPRPSHSDAILTAGADTDDPILAPRRLEAPAAAGSAIVSATSHSSRATPGASRAEGASGAETVAELPWEDADGDDSDTSPGGERAAPRRPHGYGVVKRLIADPEKQSAADTAADTAAAAPAATVGSVDSGAVPCGCVSSSPSALAPPATAEQAEASAMATPARLLHFESSAAQSPLVGTPVGIVEDSISVCAQGRPNSTPPPQPQPQPAPTPVRPTAATTDERSATHETPSHDAPAPRAVVGASPPSLTPPPRRRQSMGTMLKHARRRRRRRAAHVQTLKDDVAQWEESLRVLEERSLPLARAELTNVLRRADALGRFWGTPVRLAGASGSSSPATDKGGSPQSPSEFVAPPPASFLDDVESGLLDAAQARRVLRPALQNLRGAARRLRALRQCETLRAGGGGTDIADDGDVGGVECLSALVARAEELESRISRSVQRRAHLTRQANLVRERLRVAHEEHQALVDATAPARATSSAADALQAELRAVDVRLAEVDAAQRDARTRRREVLEEIALLRQRQHELRLAALAASEALGRASRREECTHELLAEAPDESHLTAHLARMEQAAVSSALQLESSDLPSAAERADAAMRRAGSAQEESEQLDAALRQSESECVAASTEAQRLEDALPENHPARRVLKFSDDVAPPSPEGAPVAALVEQAETCWSAADVDAAVEHLQDQIIELHETLRMRPPTDSVHLYEAITDVAAQSDEVARLGGPEVVRNMQRLLRLEAQVMTLSGEVSRVRDEQEAFAQFGAVEQYHRVNEELLGLQRHVGELRAQERAMLADVVALEKQQEERSGERKERLSAQREAEMTVAAMQRRIEECGDDAMESAALQRAHAAKREAFEREAFERKRAKRKRVAAREGQIQPLDRRRFDSLNLFVPSPHEEAVHEQAVIITEAFESQSPLRGQGEDGAGDAAPRRIRIREREIHVLTQDVAIRPWERAGANDADTEDALGAPAPFSPHHHHHHHQQQHQQQEQHQQREHFSFTTTRLLNSLMRAIVQPSIETVRELLWRRQAAKRRLEAASKIDYRVI